MIAAVAERRVEDRYGRTLDKLCEEHDFYKQQNEFWLQQIREAQNIQSKMQERYGRDAQQAVDSVVSQARTCEAEVVANIQNGAFSSVFEERPKEASIDAEGARQMAEHLKG